MFLLQFLRRLYNRYKWDNCWRIVRVQSYKLNVDSSLDCLVLEQFWWEMFELIFTQYCFQPIPPPQKKDFGFLFKSQERFGGLKRHKHFENGFQSSGYWNWLLFRLLKQLWNCRICIQDYDLKGVFKNSFILSSEVHHYVQITFRSKSCIFSQKCQNQ